METTYMRHTVPTRRLGTRAAALLLVTLTAVLLLTPATQVSAQAAGKAVIVGFHQAPGAAELALIAGLGGRVSYQYKYIPAVAATVPEAQVEVLRTDYRIAYVEDDSEAVFLAGKQVMDYGVGKVEAPGAWALGFRGQGVKVAIFDSGIDVDHPDLQDAVAGGINLFDDIGENPNNFDDCNGHGTHVAGIAGARDNGTGTVGVAPRVRLYAMRFFNCVGGGATLSRELRGLEWAINNGMQVINMSFGCCNIVIAGQAVFVPTRRQAEEQMMQAAYDRGVVLVASSGNASEPVVAFPAGYDTVIAVGATDEDDNLATFSSFGADQELTAPGVLNFSSFPVGFGQRTELRIDTDNGRELGPVAMQFAGLTKKGGVTNATIYAGLGTPGDFAGVDCRGKTALITRGAITFAEKTTNAMNAGCTAVVVHNNQPGNFNGTLGTETTADGRAWIPAVSISLEEGLDLKNQIDSRPTTTTLINVIGNHALLSGTSMAAPHVSGVAAVVLSKDPSLTPDQVRAILQQSADDKGSPNRDPVFGFGRVNARRAVEH
jgi:subtilisin family serine protease